MKSRLIAGVIAVVLVATAAFFRARGDREERERAATVIWCDPLLRTACDELDETVRVVEPGDALDELDNGSDLPDMWITVEDWPGVARSLRGPAADTLETYGTAESVASTPLAVAGLPAAIASHVECAKNQWRCLAESADREGADGSIVRVGWTPPPTSSGLATLRALANTTAEDGSASRADLETPTFSTLLDRLEPGVFTGETGSAFTRFITQPGSATVFIGPRAELVKTASERGFDELAPQPTVTLTAQVAAADGVDTGAIAASLRSQLSVRGWTSESGAPPDLAGIDAALLQRWTAQ